MIFIHIFSGCCILIPVNRQPSFTIQNPRARLVQIDHVISTNLYTNSNHWIYEGSFVSYYSSLSCHLSEYTLNSFGARVFWHIRKFSRLSVNFLCHFATFVFGFSVWFLQFLARFTENQVYNRWNWCFCMFISV